MEFASNNKYWLLGGAGLLLLYKSMQNELDSISQTEFQHRINSAQIACNDAAVAYVIAHPIDASDVAQAIKPQCEILDRLKQKYFDRFGSTYPA